METTDEHLAMAAAGGDADAFSALLARHYDRLFATAWRLTGDRAEAEDLTQDICLALPGKLASFRGTARFTTWLYRVTMNAAHDRRRRLATRTRAAEGWGAWEVERRAAHAETAASVDWLTEAMGRLKPALRETAVLILAEELSQAEAADVLGVSEGTIAWRMSEVKRALRALAAEEDTA